MTWIKKTYFTSCPVYRNSHAAFFKTFLFGALILVFSTNQSYSQNNIDTLNHKLSSNIFIPNMNTTHPFGVLISRVHHDYRIETPKTKSITINIANANIWLPLVTGFIPVNQSDKDYVSQFAWHEREGALDFNTVPNQAISLQADGIMRLYQLKFNMPINSKSSLVASTRLLSFDSGKAPFSIVTNDKVIEWVHSNVAGGEDPFARKVYGVNSKANLYYSDRNDKSFSLNAGSTLISGLDADYIYYPSVSILNDKQIYFSTGVHLGINTTKINPTIDIGTSFLLTKLKSIKNKNTLRFNFSYTLLRQGLVHYKSGVEIANRAFIHNTETSASYTFRLKNNKFLSLISMMYYQNSWFKKDERSYMVIEGDRITSHWHYAISHLYKKTAGVNLMASLQSNQWSYAIYVAEDIPVNNAPDIQTGVSVKMEW